MKLAPLFLAALAAAAATTAAATVDYLAWSTQPQTGDQTYYGQGGDDRQGACSFSENFADTNSLPWSKGVVTTVALNDAQFAAGAACGLCLKFRGTGLGLGTTPLSSGWARGFVNNRCPEVRRMRERGWREHKTKRKKMNTHGRHGCRRPRLCLVLTPTRRALTFTSPSSHTQKPKQKTKKQCAPGDLDLNIAGDGRWRVEWFATPCDVGDSKLHFKVVVSNPYWASFVISNTAVPVAAVQVKLGGAWQDLTRAFNNQWAIHGDWKAALPIPVRVTAVTGETVEDAITGEVTEGTVQFAADGDVKTGAGAPTPGFGSKPAGREFAS
jgi:hypothetical protein